VLKGEGEREKEGRGEGLWEAKIGVRQTPLVSLPRVFVKTKPGTVSEFYGIFQWR